MNQEYFTYAHGLTMTGSRMEELLGGPARKPESKLTQREMDLARSIQEITEEVMLKMTAFAHRETGMRDLCLAGGVALNCVGNGRVLREGPFDADLDSTRRRRRRRRARRRDEHLAQASRQAAAESRDRWAPGSGRRQVAGARQACRSTPTA